MKHPLSSFLYCPKCGKERFVERNEKSKKCEDCGFNYYYNPSAATVALIINDRNEILVSRRAHEPAKGSLDLPGGFVDMDETAEQGVAREVLEETGMTTLHTEYLFSQPNNYLYSGFLVKTLDLFFRCHVENYDRYKAMDDVDDLFFLPLDDVDVSLFGLESIREGLKRYLKL